MTDSRPVLPANAGERILLTLWAGGLWIAGYLVAPLLFATLEERQLAGMIAGRVFTATSYLGLACGVLLLAGALYREGRRVVRDWRAAVVCVMLALTAAGEFLLQPRMAALKAEGLLEGSAAAARFGLLHGISSSLWLVNSVLALALVMAAGTVLSGRPIRAGG